MFNDAMYPKRGRTRNATLSPVQHRWASAALMLVSTPAMAADYATRDVGSWTVSASSDRAGCFMTSADQGRRNSTVLLGLDVDGSNRLSVLNANWSIQEKEALRLTFRLSNASFPRHSAVGIAADGERGFVTSFGPAFPGTFAASKFLHITRGDVPVEELSLQGSGAAIAELRKCVDRYRDRPAAAGGTKRADDRIPVDPFSVAPKRSLDK